MNDKTEVEETEIDAVAALVDQAEQDGDLEESEVAAVETESAEEEPETEPEEEEPKVVEKIVYEYFNDENTDLALKTLHGDLTSKMLEEVQNLGQAWAKTSQSEQNDIIDRLKDNAEHQIRRIVSLMADRGFDHCPAIVDTVTHKDECKIVLKAHDVDGGLAFARRAGGGKVVVIFVDEEEYLTTDAMPKSQPDQKPLLKGEDSESENELIHYESAVDFVVAGGNVSISALQRELRVGYNIAAGIMEAMEENGIVTAQNENGVRELSVEPESEEEAEIETEEEAEIETEEDRPILHRPGKYVLFVNGEEDASVVTSNVEEAAHLLGFTEIRIHNQGNEDEYVSVIDDERVQDIDAEVVIRFTDSQES